MALFACSAWRFEGKLSLASCLLVIHQGLCTGATVDLLAKIGNQFALPPCFRHSSGAGLQRSVNIHMVTTPWISRDQMKELHTNIKPAHLCVVAS